MATAIPASGQRLVLDGIDWPTYGRLLRALRNRPAVRLTYDRGWLEIMTLSHEHENSAQFVTSLAPEVALRAPRAALSPGSRRPIWVRFSPNGIRWTKTRWRGSFVPGCGSIRRSVGCRLGPDIMRLSPASRTAISARPVTA
jgi:hypothetical protein